MKSEQFAILSTDVVVFMFDKRICSLYDYHKCRDGQWPAFAHCDVSGSLLRCRSRQFNTRLRCRGLSNSITGLRCSWKTRREWFTPASRFLLSTSIAMSTTFQSPHESTETLTVNAEKTARMLNVSVRHFHALNRRGLVPTPIRLGKCTRWRRAEIAAWLEAGCPPRDQWHWPASVEASHV